MDSKSEAGWTEEEGGSPSPFCPSESSPRYRKYRGVMSCKSHPDGGTVMPWFRGSHCQALKPQAAAEVCPQPSDPSRSCGPRPRMSRKPGGSVFSLNLPVYSRSEFSPMEKSFCSLCWANHIAHHLLSSGCNAGPKPASAKESKRTRSFTCP